MMSIIIFFKTWDSAISSTYAIYTHCVIFILISVIWCFFEGSYIRPKSATLTRSPGPFSLMVLCERDRKQCFGESHLAHILRLRLRFCLMLT